MSDSGLKTATRTEAEALRERIDRALVVAREYQRVSEKRVRLDPPDYMGAAFDQYEGLAKIVGTLEGK